MASFDYQQYVDLIKNACFSNFYTTAISIIVGLLVILMLFRRGRPANAPPYASLGFPLVGNCLSLAKNPVGFIDECFRKYGSIYTVAMGPKNLTFLIGPDVSVPFYNKGDDIMSQTEVYRFMTPVFGKGVVYDAPVEKRNIQYQGMSTGLGDKPLESYVPKIERETLEYLSQWGNEGEIDLLEKLSELTILTSSRCLHGDDVREQLGPEVARLYHDLDKGVTPVSFFFPNAPTEAHKQRDHARIEMVKKFAPIIKARREMNSEANKDRTDILQVFVDMKYKDGTTLTDDEVVGLLIALLFAGQHTSSITSTWTTMYLLHHKECFDKFMDEQSTIFESKTLSNKTVDYSHVKKMNYLECCIKESLRLQPPLIMLMRAALCDIETETFDGKKYIIPKDDIVITSPAVSGRLDTVFKNPNTFDPSRFGPERNEDQRNTDNIKKRYSFTGFGGGKHMCKGQQFGILQVKTIVSILLRNFEFTVVDKEFPEPDYTAMVVGPKNHLKVKYRRII
jgi:sterol 14-demethylase